jgi:thioredoxin reductase (NADPH)
VGLKRLAMEPRLTDQSCIFVNDLRLNARVGVNPGEEHTDQSIILDLWVGLDDLARAARTGELRDTVDYVTVARTARKVVERRHYALVETLASTIAREILLQVEASWVKVRLRKLGCLRHASAAGVEVTLGADASEIFPGALDLDQLSAAEPIVVVGGGVAGLTAMLWCHRLGHPALLIDPAAQLGGQLHLVHGLIHDVPALSPLSGVTLARRLWLQFMRNDGRWLQASLTRLETDQRGCTLWLQGRSPGGLSWNRSLHCQAVILTLGVRRRSLEVEGEAEFFGRGLLPTAAKEIQQLKGQPVVVVGGGDSACENALLLAEVGARVTLVHRGTRLSARAEFQQRIADHSDIGLRLNTRVRRFFGEAQLEGVEVEREAVQHRLPAKAALIRVGWLPNSEALPPPWLTAEGFVQTDGAGRVPGEQRVFAAGDILGELSPSIATAFGSGAIAARAAVLALENPDSGK